MVNSFLIFIELAEVDKKILPAAVFAHPIVSAFTNDKAKAVIDDIGPGAERIGRNRSPIINPVEGKTSSLFPALPKPHIPRGIIIIAPLIMETDGIFIVRWWSG